MPHRRARFSTHSSPCRRVKSYEGKLATLTAINSALQTENDKLRKAAGAKAASAAEQEVEGGRAVAIGKHMACSIVGSVGVRAGKSGGQIAAGLLVRWTVGTCCGALGRLLVCGAQWLTVWCGLPARQ